MNIYFGTTEDDIYREGLQFYINPSRDFFAVNDWIGANAGGYLTNQISNSNGRYFEDVYPDYDETKPTHFKFRV